MMSEVFGVLSRFAFCLLHSTLSVMSYLATYDKQDMDISWRRRERIFVRFRDGMTEPHEHTKRLENGWLYIY